MNESEGRTGGPAPAPGPSTRQLGASAFLLSQQEVAAALGEGATAVPQRNGGSAQSVGELVRAAATTSAFQSFGGIVPAQGGPVAVAVGILALVFASEDLAARTFDQVARAAHLRTMLDDVSVAVETVSGAGGMVSYWGFVQRARVMVILTLDTTNPERVSVADLRSLVTATAARLSMLDR